MSDTNLRNLERMQLIRQTELLLAENYPTNLIKTPLHLANGAEAIPCAILPYLTGVRFFGTYRSHHWYLELTGSPETLFLELLGKQDSPAQGRAGSMHLNYPEKGMILTSAVVSSTISIAVGDAWANRNNKNSQTVVSFGDGATEEGVFFESLNFASLKKIPVLFVCEDNDLAIHSKKSTRESYRLRDLVASCNVPYFFGRASDINSVQKLMPEVLKELKNGPVFLHLEYFRLLSHVGVDADFDQGYRSRPVNENEHDPVWNCEQSLLKQGYTQASLDDVRQKTRDQLKLKYESCLKKPDANPQFVSKHVFRTE